MYIALVLQHLLLLLLNLSSFHKHEAKADVLGSNHRRCGVVTATIGVVVLSVLISRNAVASVGSSNSSNAASAVGPESFVFDALRSLYRSIGWPPNGISINTGGSISL
ncbi:hypothetical protein ACFX13_014748 [Malus domestica]